MYASGTFRVTKYVAFPVQPLMLTIPPVSAVPPVVQRSTICVSVSDVRSVASAAFHAFIEVYAFARSTPVPPPTASGST